MTSATGPLELQVLTYNVCWECMTGSASGSAGVLGRRCGQARKTPTPCLVQAARNVDAVVERLARPPGLAFAGIQEASRWPSLQMHSKVLRSMQVLADKHRAEEIALFYASSFEPLWYKLGTVSGRPMQVVLFRHERLQGPPQILVVHLHNHHGAKGTKEVIQAALEDVPGLRQLVDGLLEDTVVLCLGDWNDPAGRIPGFAPFARFAQSPLRSKQVTFGGSLPGSCCSTDRHDPSRSSVGDYVLSSLPAAPALNEVSRGALMAASGNAGPLDASDHFPVFARVLLNGPARPLPSSPSGPPVASAGAATPWAARSRPFCVVSGYVRSKHVKDGLLTVRRTLRLQKDLRDPNEYPLLDGREHRGPQVEEGAPLLQLGRPSRSTGLVFVLAEYPSGRCVEQASP
jgi:hypothetical protein